ncbi:RNA polymerase sigma factor [Polyangium sp. y55x31]|uniref:RNA polymerase sigma factor n=1 Tax=Polyangium sp. y55x31 TaxID=3042688 RepID=UPI0024825055|nr:RNA polymerase sigma factor [Polyangium sp. y55x31]MDI1480083.1 RNA polymerase sigma factor [Polyangium sp. y55x31]
MNFRQLYDEHFPFVWRSLRRLGIREADLPDALQDVFLVVHRRLPTFEGRSKVSTWIFGICFRVAGDRRKAARVAARRDGGDELLLDAPDERADVAAEAERRQGLAQLEALLDELPLDQRAVFTLFELEGMTGEDIAQTLELPLGTVYSRLRLAREAFRRGAARSQARDRFHVPAPPSPKVPAGPLTSPAGGKR